MYYVPDKTGQDASYLVENALFTVYKDSMHIEFDIPVFEDSIVIQVVDSVNATLVKDTDYVIEDSDIDETSISKMRTYDGTFDASLVKGVTILVPFIQTYKISITYQQLYPVNIKKALVNGNALEVTPDLIANLLETVSYLEQITSPINDVTSIASDNPPAYELDAYKEMSRNFVESELHEVNVPEGRNIIRPVGGSFFKDSVAVRIQDNPDDLIEGTDYLIFRVNLDKTKITDNTSGVYEFIYVLREYVGLLEVDYHAFGGEPTVYDITSLNVKCNNIIDYLTTASFLTSDSLGNATIVRNMSDRIATLEESMRKLVNSSSYGDVTDGKTALKKIAATDNDLHFYTIAELYMVDGSSEIVTADRMHIRVQTVQSKIMFDAMITVNLNNETDKFTVNLLAENYDKGFVPFEDYSQIENAIHPQLRIVYNDDDTFTSGVLLQLGIEFKGFVEETVVIEDLSGKESCWLLLDGSTTAVPPEDNSIELPNGTAVYDETNPDSTAISTLVPFKGGFIAWAGSVSLNRPDGGYKVTEFEHYIPENVDLTKISHARLELQEGDDTLFPVRVDFIPGSDDMTGLGHFMYNSEAAYANLRIWNDVDGIKMTLSSDVDRTASATPLDLKHVFIFTD